VTRRPWWTEADDAELAVLVAELMLLMPEHRAWCPACELQRREGWPCRSVTSAIAAIINWHWRRDLLSRAEWLRRLEQERAA
jgi:hypothetical protein